MNRTLILTALVFLFILIVMFINYYLTNPKEIRDLPPAVPTIQYDAPLTHPMPRDRELKEKVTGG